MNDTYKFRLVEIRREVLHACHSLIADHSIAEEMKMWMDNVLTDGEYNRIMDKLNKHEMERRKAWVVIRTA